MFIDILPQNLFHSSEENRRHEEEPTPPPLAQTEDLAEEAGHSLSSNSLCNCVDYDVLSVIMPCGVS